MKKKTKKRGLAIWGYVVCAIIVHFAILTDAFAAGALAKIDSIDRTIDAKTYEITMSGIRGDIMSGSMVEVETAGGKKMGKITLPDGFDKFTPSMTMKTIRISFTEPVTLLAGKQIGSAGAIGAAPAPAAAATNVKACPYTAAELSAAMGWPRMKITREKVFPMGGVKQYDCYYVAADDVTPNLTVIQMQWDDPRAIEDAARNLDQRAQPVPGDAGNAKRLTAVGHNEFGITYVRNGIHATLRGVIAYRDTPAQLEAAKQKLLRLRRLP